MIYLDNAATTKPLDCAVRAFTNAPTGNPSSSHRAGREARVALEGARRTIAECMGALPNEVIFTSGSTEACNLAMNSLAHACSLWGFNEIEHSAVRAPGKVLENPENLYHKPPRAGFARMYANNETGEIYERSILFSKDPEVRERYLWFCDATAAVGHVPINFHDLEATYLAAGAHKFGGLKGAGFLLVKQGAPVTPIIHGGGQEYGLRGGTEPVPLICAMAEALKWSCDNLAKTAPYVTILRDELIKSIKREIPGAHINGPWKKGDYTTRLPGNVNVSFDGVEGTTLAHLLDERGICVSTGSACHSGAGPEPSSVLVASGLSKERAAGAIRLTIGHENTMSEVQIVVDELKEIVTYLRGFQQE